MARRPDESIRMSWPQGVNNVDLPEELAMEALREADNVDVTRRGGVRRRGGYEQVQAGDFRSVWGTDSHGYAVAGDTIYYVDSGLGLTPVVTGIGTTAPVAFEDFGGTVFWSDGTAGGRLQGNVPKLWRVPVPGVPVLSETNGSLPPGRYQVCLTGFDDEGREGAASRAEAIDLSSGGGIQLGTVFAPPELTRLAVYVTPVNGDVFYRQAIVDTPVNGWIVADNQATAPLRTQFLDSPPPGVIVRQHAGRLYIAAGHVLWYTEPFAPHLCDRRENFFLFADEITMVEPVAGGLYVAAGGTFYLSGTDPKDVQQKRIAGYGAIFGTSLTAEAQDFPELGATGTVAVWASPEGVCVGADGGLFRNLTRDRVAMPQGGAGGAMLRRERGVSQYVVSSSEEGSGFKTQDRAEARIIRNGVVI